MFVHVGQHETDVGCQQVVHLVPQRCFTQQLGSSDQVTNGHVKVSVTTGPVGDPGKWMSDQHLLKHEYLHFLSSATWLVLIRLIIFISFIGPLNDHLNYTHNIPKK